MRCKLSLKCPQAHPHKTLAKQNNLLITTWDLLEECLEQSRFLLTGPRAQTARFIQHSLVDAGQVTMGVKTVEMTSAPVIGKMAGAAFHSQ